MGDEEQEGVFLGIDLGGTQLKAARFSADGTRVAMENAASNAGGDAEEIFGALYSAASTLIGGSRLRGIGVGVAGLLDPGSGRILNSPNIPALSGFALRSRVREAFGDTIPVQMMNDANAAALGEYFAGAGAGSSSMFLLTLGTGIGGGFVIDGNLWTGAAGVGAEVGHMCIRADGPLCHCGARGCLEACVSGWALMRDAGQIAKRHPESAIAELSPRTPLTLAELASAGDRQARALWENAGAMLGTGIANLMNLLNPDRIVLVGGLGGAGDLLFEPARRAWESQAFKEARTFTSVKPGVLGKWAGVRGAIQPFLEK